MSPEDNKIYRSCLAVPLPFSLPLPIQQVYMYFRGSGKAAEMRREVARGAVRAAI